MAIAGRAMILSSKPASSSRLGARTSWKTGSPPVRRYTPSSTRQVQMDVQVGGRAESLNEGDRAGIGCGAIQPDLPAQKPRDDTAG